MKRFLATFACLLLLGTSLAQDEFDVMRGLLERGLYNSAAQVNGPALLAANPADREARLLYSRALMLAGDLTTARDVFEPLLGQLENIAEPAELNLAGLLLATEGNLAAALPLLERAWSISGSYAHAMDLARIAWQAYRLEEAVDAYLEASQTERGRTQPWPWLNIGRIRLAEGRLDDAERAFEQAIVVYETYDPGELLPSPAYVEAFYRLGTVFELRYADNGATAELNSARAHYQSALTGDPNYGPALAALERLGAGQ